MRAFPQIDLPRERWPDFRRRTIAQTAVELLHHVAYTSDCGRTVGLCHSHVAEVVRALHPGARTTPHSIRWYRSRIAEGDPDFALDGRQLPWARPKSG